MVFMRSLFALVGIMVSTVSLVGAYDIEMFTFYPYHCETNLMKQMRKVFGSDVFIETGTLGGETAFTAAPIFDAVHSVELSEHHFSSARARNSYSNVTFYHDSSDHFLESLLPHLQEKKKLLWLDAHYSGGNTATLLEESTGMPKSPIWGELTAIFKNGLSDSVILIDDISGYLLEPGANSRYPHLHQQCGLIKSNCPTAQLYVVGDLALVFDSTRHSPTVSPLVEACTASRMFDWYTSNREDEAAVLQAEHQIVKRAHESEADRICYLSGYCHCRDYRLWRGLVHLGRSHFSQAAEDFQFVLDAGLTHWRVHFYLAYALAKSHATVQAEALLQTLTPHLKDHQQFLSTTY
jgi:hypothetical protein